MEDEVNFKNSNKFKTTIKRSMHMAKIRSVDTKSEILLRKALWNHGIKYRKNSKSLPGTPDISIRKYKLAIFIDGEFWHGYDWERKKPRIKTNPEFWIQKIERNMERDISNNVHLKEMGFTVFRFWDNQVKKDLAGCIQIITQHITEITKTKNGR
jgi:DNA mismatch endonuclease (patch repair protein)